MSRSSWPRCPRPQSSFVAALAAGATGDGDVEFAAFFSAASAIAFAVVLSTGARLPRRRWRSTDAGAAGAALALPAAGQGAVRGGQGRRGCKSTATQFISELVEQGSVQSLTISIATLAVAATRNIREMSPSVAMAAVIAPNNAGPSRKEVASTSESEGLKRPRSKARQRNPLLTRAFTCT